MVEVRETGGTRDVKRVLRRLATGVGAAVLAAGAMAGVSSAQILTDQHGGIGNSGGASANTGSNSATGNSSTNTASTSVGGTGVGGLIGAVLGIGGPTNTSTGSATIDTGSAAAQGNSSASGVGQAQGTGAGGGLVNSQGANVSNVGRADANTGGNRAVGNDSTNTATITQNASGGLLGVNLNLGSPTNNSSGTANITTGDAAAVGNVADSRIAQESNAGGGGAIVGTLAGTSFVDGRLVPCGGQFNLQGANVDNFGTANADTGGNTAVGNASNNVATVTSDAGDAIDVTLGIGGPINNSTGDAAIVTGPASALGNQSTSEVSQQQCVPGAALSSTFATPTVFQVVRGTETGTLARTGQNPVQLAAAGGALLIAGYVLVRGARRRQRVYLP